MFKYRILLLILLIALAAKSALAGDWPQFRGPNRDAKSIETALLAEWPSNGPDLLWEYQGIGDGYSTVTIVNGTVYANGVIKGEKEGTLFAFDLDGKLKWKKNYGPEWAGRNPGAHTPPTYDQGKLYHMSGMGILSCINAETGDIIWDVNTIGKFQAQNLKWGIAEAPLIDGKKVICTPGGKNASLAAFDKTTGQLLWTSKQLSELSAYCSPVLVEWAGKRLVLTILAKSIVFVDIETGDLLLQIPHTAQYDISAVAPVFKEGMLYVTNNYGYGGIMYQISEDFKNYTKKWTEKSLDCHHGGVICLDGYIYGAGSKQWVCIELKTGQVKYQADGVGKGSVLYADGMLYCYGEKDGKVALVKAYPQGHQIISSFNITKGTDKHWAHPVIAHGRLYIRHGDTLMVYNVKKQQN